MHAKTNTRQPVGRELLDNAELNKGTAFTAQEREQYGLRGLLPATIFTQEVQLVRVLGNLHRKDSDIERYIFLMALLGRNERLFYRLLIENIEELMPIVYTPTVGQACQEFAHIFRQPRGFYITPGDRGHIEGMLANWPERDVRLIVVTDGQRILGLGDLGANGMGIPIGKLSLYSACAGIPPRQCMPVLLDVGTGNESLRDDPLYLGVKQPRLTGEAYTSLVDEFVDAVQKVFPRVLIQFEDFLTPNAYSLLQRYRDRVRCFNDDIQGTAAMALAGVLASCRITGTPFSDLRIMFLGAGSAATGIAELIQAALQEAGLSGEAARDRLWFVDQSGLVVADRDDLAPHIVPYARNAPRTDFEAAIRMAQPQVLIGATGAPGTFTEDVVKRMSEINERPVIFALSNPTSRAECTAEQAYRWSDGRTVFASGSPFPGVDYQGHTLRPGQGNNAYVFPGIGLGVIACNASRVSEDMFLDAARVLADSVSATDLESGAVYPPLAQIRTISLDIATAVAERAYEQNLAREPRPKDLRAAIEELMYDPTY
ncbi:malate dehydrogenase (oxaloacetate-decarboxylating)(NADP+) [Thiogranum longum]|uniref:Malate dehydrogenase (Oxaloacetate-decarboxylating)(NADP+) n=1 Tax=Thiogranum longum TaxID=1537524 RepID=A0A4R1H7B9_9GAMM|nr:NAD-dependent malic enzyme [Thiogranum longum]TCK17714.1 malate dehydrogenase (oxaloacetate-decarboxylating)(NADP+) [Thiogranum longum]